MHIVLSTWTDSYVDGFFMPNDLFVFVRVCMYLCDFISLVFLIT